MTSDSNEESNRRLAEANYSKYLEDQDMALPAALWAFITLSIVVCILIAHLPLVAMSVGISSTVIGLACFAIRQGLLRQFRYMGVKREAISKAVSYFDLRYANPNQMDPVVQSMGIDTYARAKSTEKAQAALNLVVHVANKVEWPCSEIEKLREYARVVRMTSRMTAAIAAAMLLVASVFYVSSLLFATFLLIMFVFFPCALLGIVELYRNRKVLLYGRHLDRIDCFEDVEPKQTAALILDLLARELKWPIRFYLAGDYEGLVYTGRKQTTYGLYRLKEAVLYPQETQTT